MYMTTPLLQETETEADPRAVDIAVDAILDLVFGHDTSERQYRLARIVLARHAGITLVPKSRSGLVKALMIYEFLMTKRGVLNGGGEWKECFRLEETDSRGGTHVHANVVLPTAFAGDGLRAFDIFVTLRSASTVRGAVEDVTIVYDDTACAASRQETWFEAGRADQSLHAN